MDSTYTIEREGTGRHTAGRAYVLRIDRQEAGTFDSKRQAAQYAEGRGALPALCLQVTSSGYVCGNLAKGYTLPGSTPVCGVHLRQAEAQGSDSSTLAGA